MTGRFRAVVLAVAAALAGVWAPTPAGAAATPEAITYSVRGKGNISDLEDFAARAATTYADPRGWTLGGSLRFERVASGGDFTLWLTADALMSTFGGSCDVVWSCRNGRNVVINEDRWLAASDAFLAGGGTLAEYRDMVVNHETGHWLGFGHASCSAAGALAPVMQQQSMGLQGCRFNAWPLASERATLAARRSLPIIQTGEIVGTPNTPATAPTATAPPSRPVCRDRIGRVALRPWLRCL